MPRRGAPWWVYPCVASFLAYFALLVYCDVTRPVSDGLQLSAVKGRRGLVVRAVEPASPAATAGIAAGDAIVAVDGQVVASRFDWDGAWMNARFDRPLRLEVERAGRRASLACAVERAPASHWRHREGLELLATRAVQAITLVLGLVVLVRRADSFGARLGGWLLATFGVFCITFPSRLADVWRALPAPVGWAMWLPFCSTMALPALLLSFFASFPRRMLRSVPGWLAAWTPAAAVVWAYLSFFASAVYRADEPRRLVAWFEWRWVVWMAYLVAAAVVALVSYRRSDATERRRIGVMVLGGGIGALGGWPVALIYWRGSETALFASPAVSVAVLLLLAVPLAFTYAILRHRLFDVRLIIRQGVRYALARRLLVSLVPAALLGLGVDVYLNRDRAVDELFVVRAPVYLAVAGFAGLAQWRRQRWLDALDRRFFRERYDAQRVLRRVVDELRRAEDIEGASGRVVEQIEIALHPTFVSVFTRPRGADAYRSVATAPPGAGPTALPGGAKLFGLVRVLAKPIDVSSSRAAWLAGQLPGEETALVVSSGIELLVPVETRGSGDEAMLVLGARRSEEPYADEDRELLWTIARGLGMLGGPGAEAAVRHEFAECPRCGTCYDTGTPACGSDDAALVPVRLPRVLSGRYRLERRLGRGGMGVVYSAADLSLGRDVAVKVLREELVGDAESAARFQQEARLAAQFVHPHVVTVHDFGVAAASRAFLVMERLDGRTLRDELSAAGQVAPTRTLAVMRGVCAAVDAAHRRSLVHRDLKPENIFLARVEGVETPKVLDFGIAKVLGGIHSREVGETGTGRLVGTPQYMAPEQLRGEAPQPSWDIWALAVVACEMLTGTHPFATLAIGLPGFSMPGAQPWTSESTGAPADWHEAFAGWLAVDPAARPATAAALLAELERVVSTR